MFKYICRYGQVCMRVVLLFIRRCMECERELGHLCRLSKERPTNSDTGELLGQETLDWDQLQSYKSGTVRRLECCLLALERQRRETKC